MKPADISDRFTERFKEIIANFRVLPFDDRFRNTAYGAQIDSIEATGIVENCSITAGANVVDDVP